MNPPPITFSSPSHNWVTNWELVDMHLWIFWTLPWDENDKWEWKYHTKEELAKLYIENIDTAINYFWWVKATILSEKANLLLRKSRNAPK